MALYGLYAQDGRRKKCRTTIPDVSAPPLPDLVKRDFSVGAPGQRSCGDITYVPTDEGWLYVADVEDIGSRRIVGFAMAEHMRTELVGLGHGHGHRDTGWRGRGHGLPPRPRRPGQYMSRDFRDLCAHHGISQSSGRTGSSLDNAVAESLWASLKRELVSRCRFASRADGRRAIIAWINHYNAVRLHSSLGGVPPIEWELRHYRSTTAARPEAA